MPAATQSLSDDAARISRYEQALLEIARYADWDFSKVQDPWKWCNLFIYIAKEGLQKHE